MAETDRKQRALLAQRKSAFYYAMAVRHEGSLAAHFQSQAAHWSHVARSNLFRLLSPK